MNHTGNLIKMKTQLAETVQYFLPLGNEIIPMNELIGKKISITFHHQINCIKCGKKTYKSFNQGFCYNCFLTAPEADPAVVRPELDQAHLGISRDMEWAKTYSLVDHTVYFAVSSGLKVGVTRTHQEINRWIDQGAVFAMKFAETPYRQLAGLIEVEMKQHYSDKTQWQHMLTNRIQQGIDLVAEKYRATDLLSEELRQHVSPNNEIIEIRYPVSYYPTTVKSIDLEKTPEFSFTLTGIKGQYLIFGSQVINIRKYGGYLVSINY